MVRSVSDHDYNNIFSHRQWTSNIIVVMTQSHSTNSRVFFLLLDTLHSQLRMPMILIANVASAESGTSLPFCQFVGVKEQNL